MSQLGKVFTNTYDKEIVLDKEKEKKQNFGGCNKVPHGDWRDSDHIWMLKTMDEIMNTIKKSINESENNVNVKEESTLIESSSLQNKSGIFSKEYNETKC